MYVGIYVYMYVCMHVFMYVCEYAHIFMYGCTHVYMYAHMYVHMSILITIMDGPIYLYIDIQDSSSPLNERPIERIPPPPSISPLQSPHG
jgi:hypothetical protein